MPPVPPLEEVREQLEQFINDDNPFGPIAADEIVRRPALLNFFFRDVERLQSAIRQRPALLIGRRGAGKTAYLNSVRLQPDCDVLPLNSAAVFREVLNHIARTSEDLVENNALLWEAVFLEAICFYYANRIEGVRHSAAEQLGARPIEQARQQAWYDRLWRSVCHEALPTTGTTADAVAEKIERFQEELMPRVVSHLKKNGRKLFLLIDSLEELKVNADPQQQALKGLLVAVARYQTAWTRVDVQLCIPSELMPTIEHFAANPLKELSSRTVLRWSARELLDIAAHRFNVYLHLYYPGEIERLGFPKLSEPRPYGEKLRVLFKSQQITNRLSRNEDVLHYIVRHTQLLPRQLLIFLNDIFKRNSRSSDAFKIDGHCVVEGVQENENQLVTEVSSAFRHIYPQTDEILEATVPNLSAVFPYSELEQVFKMHACAVGIFNKHEFTEFRKMLFDLGVLGIVEEESADGIVHARFQYYAPGTRMPAAAHTAHLAVHPVFCGVLGAKRVPHLCGAGSQGAKTWKIVYPRGCIPETETSS